MSARRSTWLGGALGLAIRLLVVGAVALGILGGCAPRPADAPQGGPSGLVASAPPRVGAAASDFALTDLAGNTVTLSGLRGRSVLVNFWASWCGPCRVELPHLTRLYNDQSGQAFELLAVNVREDAERVQRFADANQMSFPVLLDRRGQVAAAYYVRGLPTSVFVDAQGIIRAIHVGILTESLLREYMETLGTNAPR
ncbi:MAG: TlpA disulfide reductase family protein [Chloroflexota bacterium]